MVNRTEGGIKYDRKVKSDSRSSSGGSMPKPKKSSGGSGSKKLREFKKRHEARSSPGQSPEEYREKAANQSAEETKARQLITGTGEVDRTQTALNKLKAESNPTAVQTLYSGMQSLIDKNKDAITQSQAYNLIQQYQEEKRKKALIQKYGEGDYRAHINPDESILAKLRDAKDTANKKVSGYIPSYYDVIEKRDELEKANPKFGSLMASIRETAYKNEKVGKVVDAYSSFGKGVYDEVDKNPVDVGVTVVSGYGTGAAFKVGSTGARLALAKGASSLGKGSIAKVGAKGLTLTSKAMEPALAVGGAAFVGTELRGKSPEELGRATPHLLAGLYGGVKGWNAGGKIVGRIQTAGRTEIPLESITDVKVATGKQTYPNTRVGQTPDALVKEFKADSHGIPTDALKADKYGVWHAAPEKFPGKVEILNNPTRPTDVGGLYVSPRLSPAFTRVSGANEGLSLRSLLSSDPIRPSASRVYVKDINRLPTGGNVAKGQKFLSSKANVGEAYLTPNAERLSVFGAVESEAVVTPKTILKQFSSGKKYYTTINGRRVPIDTYEVGGVGKKTGVSQLPKSNTKTTGEIIESSYLKRGSPLPKVYPSLSSGVRSSKPLEASSLVSSQFSSPVSSIVRSPSSKPSSVISRPSSVVSRPSKNPSEVIRSATSRAPSRGSSKGSGGSSRGVMSTSSKATSIPEKRSSKRKGSKKQKSSPVDWEYRRTTNKFKSPLDVEIKGKGLV